MQLQRELTLKARSSLGIVTSEKRQKSLSKTTIDSEMCLDYTF